MLCEEITRNTNRSG